MTQYVLRADGLGKRFGRGTWGLRDCDVALPPGRIAALVGPNGAGKTTLLKLATGLLAPTEGRLEVLGVRPSSSGTPDGLSFLAQDKPLYRTFRVAEMVRAGAALNSGGRWDAGYVRRLIDEAGIAMTARIGTLSGGQWSRVALALALGRRPDLLLLDEPLADLDPLARRQVMQALLAEVAETGLTVLLSSHVVSDLEDVCDHLVLIRDGRAWLAGDIEPLLAGHRLVTGPAAEFDRAGLDPAAVVHRSGTGRGVNALLRGEAEPPGCAAVAPTLEDLVLGYLQAPAAADAAVAEVGA
ncbi:ATP-binding cassette domain-containing protein [Pseudonocardia hispaniensis]|uniref:ATP-binding cassette domain-containing protein n=1 Tax=Pseudonocardia hispaniensis TaxID=904933 RepID=A0ABW1IYF0_9PSEU